MDADTGCEQLEARVADGVGWLTIDNPARRNALSLELLRALIATTECFDADPDVRVIVLTGAGGKVFASGADISVFAEGSVDAVAEFNEAYQRARRVLRECSLPVIAMIRGRCIGGGLALALAADLRVCSAESQFAIPAARLGLGYSDVEPLVRVIGASWAAEMLFTARALSGDEALQIGLVNRVVPDEDLTALVEDLTTTIVANAPLSIAAGKAALTELGRDPALRDLERLERLVQGCRDSEDFAEGLLAFREKRSPNFKGR